MCITPCTTKVHNTAQNSSYNLPSYLWENDRSDDVYWRGGIDWAEVLRPTRHKIGHFEDVSQANLLAWYGKTKPNTTNAHIHQSKQMYYNTKTKARFSRLLHLSWKWRGPILDSVLHKSVTYLLRHLPTYLQPRTHMGLKGREFSNII